MPSLEKRVADLEARLGDITALLIFVSELALKATPTVPKHVVDFVSEARRAIDAGDQAAMRDLAERGRQIFGL